MMYPFAARKSAPWKTGRFCVAPLLILVLALGLPVFSGCGLKSPPQPKWETPAERQEELEAQKGQPQEADEEETEDDRSETQQGEKEQQEPEDK